MAAAGRAKARCVVALCVGLWLAVPAHAQENTAAALLHRYQALRAQLAAKPLGVPARVDSSQEGDELHGEVYALLEQPFNSLLSQLTEPAVWCQLALLHLNTKACTTGQTGGRDWLTLYSGRKGFEAPGSAYPLRFAFQNTDVHPVHLEINLRAQAGPLGSSDYRITVAAIPVAQGSFVRVSYAFRTSTMSRLATQVYLSTLGQGKQGFTVTGNDGDGKPQYVRGLRGVVERNAVRYYFAVQAYLECLSLPQPQRFERALARWFDLTEQYPVQLHEIERLDYLQSKRQEYDEQRRLQQTIDAAAPAAPPVPAL